MEDNGIIIFDDNKMTVPEIVQKLHEIASAVANKFDEQMTYTLDIKIIKNKVFNRRWEDEEEE